MDWGDLIRLNKVSKPLVPVAPMDSPIIHRRRMIWFLFFKLFLNFQEAFGTTIAAVRCRDGIVIAADSISTANSYVAHKQLRKLFLLTPSTALCCVSEGSADFGRLYDDLRETVKSHELECGQTLGTKAIAHYARKLMSSKYREAHVLIAGSDMVPNRNNRVSSFSSSIKVQPATATSDNSHAAKRTEDTKSPLQSHTHKEVETEEYMLCEILPSGSRVTGDILIAGSGSALITPLVEDMFASYEVESSADGGGESVHNTDRKKLDQPSNTQNDSARTTAVSKVETSTTPVRHRVPVQAATKLLRRALSMATRLDQRSGGSRHTMWVFSKEEGVKESL